MATGASARDLYTERAGSYHRFVAAVRYAPALRAAFRGFEPLRSDMKILDAGCGGGLLTLAVREALADRGLRPGVMHGFDLTPAMLGRFHDALQKRGTTGVELRQADVLRLDTLPSSWQGYDLIVSSAMLEYVPKSELPAALRALRLRLGGQGVLVFFISRRNWLMRVLIERWWHAHLYTRSELAEVLGQAGFSSVRFRRFPASYAHLGLWGHFVEARS
jgi:cyclopropane fatty-acyl-phospholipid synthase-like methyltransferase